MPTPVYCEMISNFCFCMQARFTAKTANSIVRVNDFHQESMTLHKLKYFYHDDKDEFDHMHSIANRSCMQVG